MRTGRDFDKAAGIWSRVNILKQTRYTVLRPKVSESGAKTRGPTPSIITKPVWHPMIPVSVEFRASAICLIPGAKMLEAKGLRTDST